MTSVEKVKVSRDYTWRQAMQREALKAATLKLWEKWRCRRTNTKAVLFALVVASRCASAMHSEVNEAVGMSCESVYKLRQPTIVTS